MNEADTGYYPDTFIEPGLGAMTPKSWFGSGSWGHSLTPLSSGRTANWIILWGFIRIFRILRRSAVVLFAIWACLLSLLSCSPIGSKEPSACNQGFIKPDGQQSVTVFFGTNRLDMQENAAVPIFGVARATKVTYGKVAIDFPPDGERRIGAVDSLRVSGIERLSEDAFWAALSDAARAQRIRFGSSQDLVFVHGYNESFERTAIRAAQIVRWTPSAGQKPG